MSEERAAKLKLKRRKGSTAQDMQGAGARPGLPVRTGSAGSWFEEIGLTAAERTWKQVLNSAYPDLKTMSWGAVPSLPGFGNKPIKIKEAAQPTSNSPALSLLREIRCPQSRQVTMSRENGGKVNEQIPREVFKVGQEIFEWIPFPTDPVVHAGNEQCVNRQEVCVELEQDAGNFYISSGKLGLEFEDTAEQLNSRLNVEQLCVELPKQKNKHLPDKHSVQKCRERDTSVKQSLHKQSSAKITREDKVWSRDPKGDDQPTQGELRKEPHFYASTMQYAGEEIRPSGITTKNLEGTADKGAEAMGSLESCPMCLTQFSKQLSPLDIDSHLAQCLSETTEDVTW
ncbi:Fanconi anemia core complex-associated protein 20 isoform X3 [Ascaphus truei]